MVGRALRLRSALLGECGCGGREGDTLRGVWTGSELVCEAFEMRFLYICIGMLHCRVVAALC